MLTIARPGRYVTTREYARAAGLSHTAACWQARTGRLPALRIGRVWLIHEHDVPPPVRARLTEHDRGQESDRGQQ